MRLASTLAAGALIAGASAENYLGFNSGATLADRSAKFKKDFQEEFETAQNLNGAPGTFNSVRLYTNIQAYSDEDPIEAFDAAVDTKTKILLGVWTSDVDSIDKEINALQTAIKKHGDDLTKLVIGVSIGSEDLYRNTPTSIENDGGIGAKPEVIVGFIDDWKKAFKDTPLAKVPVGHVDTWDAWGIESSKAVIDAIDFLGVDEYPYYEKDKGNDIKNAGKLFDKAYQATLDAAGDKEVWVTETGWPATGPAWDEAEASVKNAKTYWDEVGCRKLFNKTPTFWYNLRDSNPDNEMKFAISKDLSTEPLFDLSCPDHFDTPTSTEGGNTASSTQGGPTSAFNSASPTSTGGAGNGGSPGGSDSNASEDGAAAQPTTDEAAASSLKMLSTAAYGALALCGGLMALL